MDGRLKVFNGVLCLGVFAALSLGSPVFAKSATSPTTGGDKQKYIVILEEAPLASFDGRSVRMGDRDQDLTQLQATANHSTGAQKLDVNAPASKKYLRFLDKRFESVRGESALKLGRQLKTTHRYRNAVNGFATELNETEVHALRDVPGVRSVIRDKIHKLETDSGPNWIGADAIHDGSAGTFPATGGEGVVVGVIDSGVNWDHPSFTDPGEGGDPVLVDYWKRIINTLDCWNDTHIFVDNLKDLETNPPKSGNVGKMLIVRVTKQKKGNYRFPCFPKNKAVAGAL